MCTFRKATIDDLNEISKIYSDIHTFEENGILNIGWVRGVYPTEKTAEASIKRGDMFVAENSKKIIGAAIINKNQVDSYKNGKWHYNVSNDEIMTLHTLVISPYCAGKGYGKMFIEFYEQYALSNGCSYLRLDTNEKNTRARFMYKKLGYNEIGIISCDFNGIKNIGLVLLEKKIG